VELYLLVGDHDLSGTYDKKLNAYKIYTMAIVSAIEADIANWGQVASHILFKIASADSPVRANEVDRLLFDLQEFLAAQAPIAERAMRYLLWPFHLAAQLFPLRKQPRRFLEAVKKLVSPNRIDRYLGHVG
jgi:hypothetical protein